MAVQKKHKAVKLIRTEPSMMSFPVRLGEVVEFKNGLPGFEHITQYRFRFEDGIQPFLFMDAQDDSGVSFVCVDTFYLVPDYEINMSPELVKALEVDELEDIAVFSIATVGESVQDTTANLMSPLIVNLKSMLGEQVILENSTYPVQFHIWDALQKQKSERKTG